MSVRELGFCSMRWLSFILLAILVLSGCGGGGGGDGGDGSSGNSTPSGQLSPLTGGGTKGPLALAQVRVYGFDASKPGFKTANTVADGATDEAASITGVKLPAGNNTPKNPLILEIVADADTYDLTTGVYPLITMLRTTLTGDTQNQVADGQPVYATPLTTVAHDLAVALSGENPSISEFEANLAIAGQHVVLALGFGMSPDIDIFRANSVLTSADTSLAAQQQVAEYRTAIESFTAIVEALKQEILVSDPLSKITHDDIVAALAQDLVDGFIDGQSDGVVIEDLQDIVDIASIASLDPATLTVPGTDTSLNDVEAILMAEAAVTCNCTAATVTGYLNQIDFLPTRLTLVGYGASDGLSPYVVGAISTSNTSAIVTFSRPMGESALQASHYSIVQENVYGEAGTLSVKAAVFNEENGRLDKKAVVLTTASQNEVTYRVMAVNVKDVFGSQLAPAGHIIGTTILVNPSSSIFAGTPLSGAPVELDVVLTDADGNPVVLLQGSVLHKNADGSYDIVDAEGNAAPVNVTLRPDGLSDAEEQRGYVIFVEQENGEQIQREVTSDPGLWDTDGDGVSDFDERQWLSDPRDPDTDNDGLSDYQELNEIYSSVFRQDSDGDGLGDGLEYNNFETSPIFADTDGDQILDGDEIPLGNRDPRIADLPVLDIDIGDLDLKLDVRFSATSTEGTRDLETRAITSSLSKSSERKYSKSSERVSEGWFEVGVKFGQKRSLHATSDAAGFKEEYTFEQEFKGGGRFSTTNTWSNESTNATQRAYEDSRSTDLETSAEETVTREVVGGRVDVAVTLSTSGDIAFNVDNIQLTVLMQDLDNPGTLLPIATLVPDPAGAKAFSLGPLSPPRGPLIFTSTEIFPAQVERLMRDPRGLSFVVSNYSITDEGGRKFAFTSQDINDRTASVEIDYGAADTDDDGVGENAEIYRVATTTGRRLDTNNDNIIDDEDRRVLFSNGFKPVGITVSQALEDVLGLTHYDHGDDAGLSEEQLQKSYSTIEQKFGVCEEPEGQLCTEDSDCIEGVACVIAPGAPTVQGLWRFRNVSSSDDLQRRQWTVMSETGIDPQVDVRSKVLQSNAGIWLAFVADVDNDFIPARIEYSNGCSDESPDTDGDGVDDRIELYEGWPVNVTGKGEYTARSNCARKDTDRDLLDDNVEQAGGFEIDYDGDGSIDTTTTSLDASNSDTDEDGISDYEEIFGYVVVLRFGDERDANGFPVEKIVSLKSNPLNPDTDGDNLSDGEEQILGTNPIVSDGNAVFDDDGDGLVNFEEKLGWVVNYEAVSQEPGQTGARRQHASFSSNTRDPDTDGDTLSDYKEKLLLSHPAKQDSDDDGLSDSEEAQVDFLAGGLSYEILQPLGTNVLDADTDNDTVSDGTEIGGWFVRVPGKAPKEVFSDPTNPDTDGDQVPDGVEFALFRSDPTEPDTDGDTISDLTEIQVGTNPVAGGELCVLAEFVSLNMDGNCDLGDDGADCTVDSDFGKGDITGALDINGARVLNVQQSTTAVNGDVMCVGDDETVGFTVNARRYYKVAVGGTLTFSTNGIQDNDSGSNIDRMTNTSDIHTYESLLEKIQAGNYRFDSGITTTGPADGIDNNCGMNIRTRITIMTDQGFEDEKVNGSTFCNTYLNSFRVPDLVGLHVDEVQAAATAMEDLQGWSVGSANFVSSSFVNSDTMPANYVISQSPEAGSVTSGSGLTMLLIVSAGPEVTNITVPDLLGLTRVEAEIKLLNASLELGLIETANDPFVEFGRVISQSIAAGDSTPEGTFIDIVLSNGPAQ